MNNTGKYSIKNYIIYVKDFSLRVSRSKALINSVFALKTCHKKNQKYKKILSTCSCQHSALTLINKAFSYPYEPLEQLKHNG